MPTEQASAPRTAGQGSRGVVFWIRLILPYVVAASLLAYIFFKVPLGQVIQQLRAEALWTLVPLVFFGVTALFLLDCLAMWKTIEWVTCPIRFREVVEIRGASYLLAAVNYNLGQGSVVYFLYKRKKVEMLQSTGTVLLIMGAEFAVLVAIAGLGVIISDRPAVAALKPYVYPLAGVYLVYLVLTARPPRWLSSIRIFKPALDAGLLGNLKVLLIRVPHMLVLFLMHWAALELFNIHVPVGEALAALSAVFIVVVLPISIQGLGTGQAASVALLSGYAASGAATVLAYSLSVWVLGVICQVLVGLLFFKRGAAMIRSAS